MIGSAVAKRSPRAMSAMIAPEHSVRAASWRDSPGPARHFTTGSWGPGGLREQCSHQITRGR